ncbi:MAG: NADH:flavin oxidoreductase, partial [Proteobacteria bacterium]|nr:NADH:flavin oxidoreductase [Pseudomonadota bacterium]
MAVDLLRQPGAIGPLRLKNRVIMGPLGTNYGTTDGYSTDRDKAYYAERAKGGAAMIITEAMNISAAARNHRASLCVFHDRFIPGLAAVVRAIQDNGALAVAQLNHRGRLLQRAVLNTEPVGPSDGVNRVTGDTVRGLTVDEIVAIERDFVAAGVRLARAGYDAIELHAANGYLFQQFFSERFNHRTDAYGGTLDNRMRFLLETIGRLRERLPDTPLLVRVSATEYAEGGYSMDEAVALAQALERAGVAAIDLSGGTNESPELSRYCIQPPSFPRRFLEPYARPIKAAVGVPVIMAGRIVTPDDAEAVLAAGSADFVALCRALVADPHWCLKAFGAVDAPIRRCIYCNVCYER